MTEIEASQNNLSLNDIDFIQALSAHRKKLYWRAIRRGMKESDLLLGGFARQHLATMSDTELQQFEAILSLFDADFLNYVTGKNPVPADLDTPLFHAIKAFKPYEFQ